MKVVVVGAGMGGLTAALRLARLGHRVRVLEARTGPGGLASSVGLAGLAFDVGPYIVLDRAGLVWAFGALGVSLTEAVDLVALDHVYTVAGAERTPIAVYADAMRTAAEFDRTWPRSGQHYREFVNAMLQVYQRTRPLLSTARPGVGALLRTGAWRDAPFLLRSLGSVLGASGLPRPVVDAIAIWTHVAGQPLAEAPSPMALLPALIHGAGAFYARGGIGTLGETLARYAAAAGVELHYGTAVRRITTGAGRVTGVETEHGDLVTADAIVSNANGVGTYLELLDDVPARVRITLGRLPLQSPGVCAYLRVRPAPPPPYLRFWLPSDHEPCRLLVVPGAVDRKCGRDGWWPARLIAPLEHAEAERIGLEGQRRFLERLLAERWWRDLVGDAEVLATRVPAEWGAEFRLHRASMNPIMTGRFMRAGRMPHRSPLVRGLYLAGGSTHPGQWISFCAISGILAADQLHCDLA